MLWGSLRSEAAALTDRFRSELFLTSAYTVLERDRMEEILQEQGFQQAGCSSNDCMAEIGKLLNVQQIFAGSVSQFGNLFTVMIRQIDVESGKIVNSQALDFSGGKEKMMTEGMRNLARYFAGGKAAPVFDLLLRCRPTCSPPSIAKPVSNISGYPAVLLIWAAHIPADSTASCQCTR